MFSISFTFLLAATHTGVFHFAIIGDRTGRAIPGVYEQTWLTVEAQRPDFIVTVGDAIEGMDDARARTEWDSVKRSWGAAIPVYHTPGNHDIWDAFSERLYAEETGRKLFYSFDFRQLHIVVLDNSRTEDLAPAQLQFLEDDLAHLQAAGPAMVFFHRAYWLIPMKLGVTGFALQTIAKKYGVCCIVSGHGHQYQSLKRDGVQYLEVGSSGASLERAGAAGIGFEDGWFYQYVWVTVDGAKVSFEVRELGPPWGQGRRVKLE